MNFKVTDLSSAGLKGLLIQPYSEHDMPLFQHCAEGMTAVYPDYFSKILKPVLRAHGVTSVFHFFNEQGQKVSEHEPPQ